MFRPSRRDVIRYLGSLGLASLAGVTSFPALSSTNSGARIVIIGGGFGGAACAKYLRRYDPGLSITLIEPKDKYISCLFSNSVLGGLHPMDFITHGYDNLASNNDIKLIRDQAISIEPANRKVVLSDRQKIDYDHLVVSPGIDFRWNQIEGYDEEVANLVPHAWQAGKQTELLRSQLQSMEDGGVVIISTPTGNFRAPPAPYERASMIAYYLSQEKPKSKVLLLDSGTDFDSQELYTKAWNKMYPGMIEWVGGSSVVKLDAAQKTVETTSGDILKGDVINLIPPQRAGKIAFTAGLTDESGWCPVNQKSFASTHQDFIHVIGDSCIAGDMFKAGSAANSQAKACAAGIISSLSGKDMPDPVFMDVFYGVINKHYAISRIGFYELVDQKIKKTAGGLSSKRSSDVTRHREMVYAEAWYHSITNDTFN